MQDCATVWGDDVVEGDVPNAANVDHCFSVFSYGHFLLTTAKLAITAHFSIIDCNASLLEEYFLFSSFMLTFEASITKHDKIK